MKYLLDTDNLSVEIISACDTLEELIDLVSIELGITKFEAELILDRSERIE